MQLAERAEDLRGAAHQLEGRREARGQAPAEMDADLAREHDGQPRHEEGARDGEEDRARRELPALAEPGQEAHAHEGAAEERAQPDERAREDLEGGERVALVAAAALDRDGRLGVAAAELLELGGRKRGDHAGDQGDPGRAAVEQDEDHPEIPDGFHVRLA